MFNHQLFTPVRTIFGAYWKSDRLLILLIVTVVLVASISSISAPYLFSRLVDKLATTGNVSALIAGFALYALLFGVASILQQMVQYLSFMSAENLGFVTSTRFFKKLLQKPATFFIEHNPVEIQNAIQKGRSALVILLQMSLIAFIPGMTTVLLTVSMLGAVISAELILIVVVYGAITVWLTLAANEKTRIFLDNAVEAGQEQARFVGNSINAMETLRQFGSSEWMQLRFIEKASEVRNSWRSYVVRRIIFLFAIGVCLTLQLLVTYYLLLPRYEAGLLTIGDIVLFNTLMLQLNVPFEMIAHSISDYARLKADLQPMVSLWTTPDESSALNASPLTITQGKLEFRNVSYNYDNGRGVDDISFTANRGRITFLVGETGSGKSTIFKLALKSNEPQSGQITVDSQDLNNIDRQDWYNHIAVVPQEVMLLNESLADNILLGRERDDQQLRRAADKASILQFIENLSQGFDTKIGERGLKLSGGERQRIAIARALYGAPSFLFLDEASSALDEATERDIMQRIREYATDVTIIAITHRKTVISDTDLCINLDRH